MGPSRCAALSATVALTLIPASCRPTGPIVVHGELPGGTQTVVVSFEQEKRRAVFAHPVSEGGLEVELPDVIEAPISLVRLSFREAIAEFGLSRSAPLPSVLEYSRPLASLRPLAIETATMAEDSTRLAFGPGGAPAWLLEQPIWRADTCPAGVRGELAFESGLPRGVIALGANLAAGVSDTSVVFVRPEGAPFVFPLRPDEAGRGAALGGDDRWWVLTNSRAVAVDPVSGQILTEHALPEALDPLGMTEDPGSGDLYYFSMDAELWRQSVSSTVAEVFYEVPPDRVRRSSLPNAIPRFYFVDDRTLLIAVEDVNAVLEVKDGAVRLVSEVVPDSGYISFQRPTTGEVFLAERDSQTLYRYANGELARLGRVPSQVQALSAAADLAARLLFASARGSVGATDLNYADPCPEVWLETGELVEGLALVGARHLTLARRKPERAYFYWLEMSW